MKKISEKQLLKATDKQAGTLATNLYNFRFDLGLAQGELALRAGIDRKTVNRIENGHFSPSLETITRLATALDVTVASMVK